MDPTTSSSLEPAPPGLEKEVRRTSAALGRSFHALLASLPGLLEAGPQRQAELLGLDKVLTSRLGRALRERGPLAFLQYCPGPEPLRRVLQGAARLGAPAERLAAAEAAVADFQRLLRGTTGGRSGLDALLAGWVPAFREDYDARWRQAAFKALSQLKGVTAETNLATVLFHPSPGGERIDVVWILGLLGLRRLRPGAPVKFATRRMGGEGDRRPRTLDGQPVEDLRGLRLDRYCSADPAPLVCQAGSDVVHYTLGPTGLGLEARTDLLLAEVNPAELPRHPGGDGRRRHAFAEVGTPVRRLLFDFLLHRDLDPGVAPEVLVYDTVLEGVADLHDPARDLDRWDLQPPVEDPGPGLEALRTPEFPRYTELLEDAFRRLGWDPAAFRAWRCRLDHPPYGSQVVLALPPEAPDGGA